MEIIKADISANYNDRDIRGNTLEVNFDDEIEGKIWFNMTVSQKREDDTITLSVNVDDLLMAIGKAVKNHTEDEE